MLEDKKIKLLDFYKKLTEHKKIYTYQDFIFSEKEDTDGGVIMPPDQNDNIRYIHRDGNSMLFENGGYSIERSMYRWAKSLFPGFMTEDKLIQGITNRWDALDVIQTETGMWAFVEEFMLKMADENFLKNDTNELVSKEDIIEEFIKESIKEQRKRAILTAWIKNNEYSK